MSQDSGAQDSSGDTNLRRLISSVRSSSAQRFYFCFETLVPFRFWVVVTTSDKIGAEGVIVVFCGLYPKNESRGEGEGGGGLQNYGGCGGSGRVTHYNER